MLDKSKVVLTPITVRAEILRARLKELGWTPYKLAKEVMKIRKELYGDNVKSVQSLSTAMKEILEDPSKTNTKTLESIIMAMKGEIIVRWTNERTISETRDLGLSDNSSNPEED